MGRQQPGSVTMAVRALLGLVALSGLTAVLTIVLHDRLVESWSSGHTSITDTVRPPAFIPVAIVLFLVLAGLIGVLVVFFLERHNWARLSLAGLVVFMAVGALTGLRIDPPLPFVILVWVSVALSVVLLVTLWHKDTNAYLRGADLAARPGSSDATSASS